jgi:hypothetical protein
MNGRRMKPLVAPISSATSISSRWMGIYVRMVLKVIATGASLLRLASISTVIGPDFTRDSSVQAQGQSS